MELKYRNAFNDYYHVLVLIVPYGIEIQEDFEALKDEICINCTLWN